MNQSELIAEKAKAVQSHLGLDNKGMALLLGYNAPTRVSELFSGKKVSLQVQRYIQFLLYEISNGNKDQILDFLKNLERR